jgi:hypothetical protein
MSNLIEMAHIYWGGASESDTESAPGTGRRTINLLIERWGHKAGEWRFAIPQRLTTPDYIGKLGDTAYLIWFENELTVDQRAHALAYVKRWYPECPT